MENVKTLLENHLAVYQKQKKKYVFTCSAINNINIKIIWKNIQLFYLQQKNTGKLDENRDNQNLFWLKKIIEQEYINLLYKNPKLERKILEFKKKSIKNLRKTALDIIKQL